MIEYNQNQLTIRIPISGMQELHAYQKGILGVLSEIDIDNASLGLEDHLKRVYQLLSHLLLDEEFLNRHENLLTEYRELVMNCAGKIVD